MSLTFLISLLIGYILTFFIKEDSKKYVWRRIARFALPIAFILRFIRIKTYKMDKLPKGPCVIAMNHRSISDTLSLLVMMDRYFFVITRCFDAFPKLYGMWMKNLKYIPIFRNENDKKRFKIGVKKSMP